MIRATIVMNARVRKQASISSQVLPIKHDCCHNKRKRLNREAHGPFYEEYSRLPEKRPPLKGPFELDQQVSASIWPSYALDSKKVPVHNHIDAAEPVQGLSLNYAPKGDVSSPNSPLEREANEVATCLMGANAHQPFTRLRKAYIARRRALFGRTTSRKMAGCLCLRRSDHSLRRGSGVHSRT
jgi:hypothetical protein